MKTIRTQRRWLRTELLLGLFVITLACLVGQPKFAPAQNAWTSESLAKAAAAIRAHQSKSQNETKSQKKGGDKGDFEIQVSGTGTSGRIAKWTDDVGTLGNSVITELTNGNIGIGTTSPGAKLHVASDANGGIRVSSASGIDVPAVDFLTSGTYQGTFGVAAATNQVLSGSAVGDFVLRSQNNLLFGAAGAERMRLTSSGSVGIGTTSPSTRLHVVGDVTLTGTGNITNSGNITATGTIQGGNVIAKYQDVAEWVPASRAIAAGTVVTLDLGRSNHVLPSSHSYDTRVAGVVSEKPGVILGEGGEGKVMVATTGRVRVKVDATSAPIRVGDLLVTSDKEGVAMRSQPLDLGGTPIHRPGTLIGKALEPLEKGVGEILVLLSLQ